MNIFECQACNFYSRQLTKAEKKIEELDETKEDIAVQRAYLIENNTFEERCSEATHYTWLDGKIEELEKYKQAYEILKEFSDSIIENIIDDDNKNYTHLWLKKRNEYSKKVELILNEN
jgi:uncharacterized protein YydD (DUF2326 family)